MVVNLQRPSDDWLSSTFNIFAAIDDDEEGLQRQRDAINRFQDDSWKGGWYTWEINGMSVVCCWNGILNGMFLCLLDSPDLRCVVTGALGWSSVMAICDGCIYEWNRSTTTTIGWADDENFKWHL